MTEFAQNPRADVNQDGVVDAADLLAIRSPENWQRKIRPEGVPELTVIRYDGTDPDGCAVDVRSNGYALNRTTVLSKAHGIVADPYWKTNGLYVRNCDIQTEGYGLYSGASTVIVVNTTIAVRNRDPIRIVGGFDMDFVGGKCAMPLSDVATRIHGDAYDIIFIDWDFHCWSWGVDLGEQYRGAGGVVHHVTFYRCRFYASVHTMYGVRVRAQHVTLKDCKGIGFASAQPGAALVTFERHSCDPIGGVVEGCTCDGRPIVKQRWHDTEVVP